MQNKKNLLKPITKPGHLQGFKILFKRENMSWWKTFRWLGHILLWVISINGIMAFVLFALVPLGEQMGETELANFNPVAGAASVIYQIGSIAFAIGTVVTTHNCIYGERKNGITEWLLSKPVSRSSYVLSKLFSNGIGIFLNMLLIPSLIGYILISLATKTTYAPGAFCFAFLGLIIHTTFYLSLSIFLGIVSHSRNTILGVSFGVLFGGIFIVSIFGPIVSFLPWVIPNILPALATRQEIPFSYFQSYIFTAILSVLLILISLYKMEKLEI